MPIPASFGGIRSWSSADAAALVKYANNRSGSTCAREAGAAAFLEMVGRQSPTTFFAIATQEEAIGGIGISINRDVHGLTAEMGYWLGEPYCGKGLMTEAVAQFTEYAFEYLLRIYAEPYAGNANSCRVLEKAGYVFPQ